MKPLARATKKTMKDRLGEAGFKVRPCDACAKLILDVVTDAGKRQVLDISAPVYALGQSVTKEGVTPLAVRATGVFVSHFATCTDPNRFSGKP